ncbi:hypothetical protein BJ170DRAFT_279422 [Xylariales sp. AK1849]|nr:hypothetical protein BJ170DRAFT_279422 [Xylariales sp. AK1849]
MACLRASAASGSIGRSQAISLATTADTMVSTYSTHNSLIMTCTTKVSKKPSIEVTDDCLWVLHLKQQPSRVWRYCTATGIFWSTSRPIAKSLSSNYLPKTSPALLFAIKSAFSENEISIPFQSCFLTCKLLRYSALPDLSFGLPAAPHHPSNRIAAVMYRRGPSRATPASVKCQKCLKNDKSSSLTFPFNLADSFVHATTRMIARRVYKRDLTYQGLHALSSCSTRSWSPS